MKIASIDLGTTNTRVYIINEQGKIFGKGTREVGVKDTAISGSNNVLKEGLKEAFYDAVDSAGLKISDLDFAISAGMITSELGLIVVPHRQTPAGMEELAENLVKVEDKEIFPIDLPIYFIPGIRNRFDPAAISIEDTNTLDFMRGEEAQVAGILQKDSTKHARIMTVLSSHTKFVSIDDQNRVTGSLTTISGQFYAAVIKETFIGKSTRETSDPEPEDYFDGKIVDYAVGWIGDSGIIRTLMLTRFMDVLIKTNWYERRFFVESAIAAEDLRSIKILDSLGFSTETEMTLVGNERRCRIYKYILENHYGWKGEISMITDTEEIDQLNILGSLYIAGKAGLIK